MRLQLDEILTELKLRLQKEKSIRNTVWLKDAITAIDEYKKAIETS